MEDPFTLSAPADDRTPLQRFLDGADDIDLGDLRREIADVLTLSQALRLAYVGGVDLLAAWSKQAGGLAEGLFGSWHPDPFVRGMLHGEGYAWSRCQHVLITAVNALKMREAAEVKRDS